MYTQHIAQCHTETAALSTRTICRNVVMAVDAENVVNCFCSVSIVSTA